MGVTFMSPEHHAPALYDWHILSHSFPFFSRRDLGTGVSPHYHLTASEFLPRDSEFLPRDSEFGLRPWANKPETCPLSAFPISMPPFPPMRAFGNSFACRWEFVLGVGWETVWSLIPLPTPDSQLPH